MVDFHGFSFAMCDYQRVRGLEVIFIHSFPSAASIRELQVATVLAT